MKKIFTLMLTVSLATAAFAQYDNRQGNERNNDITYNDRHENWGNDRYKDGDRHDDRRNYFKKREMERQIADINREYDRKICNVKDDWFMNPFRKQRVIKELENRRKCEINELYGKYNGRGQGRNW
jgi:Ni/Co efflux regulator RcnB